MRTVKCTSNKLKWFCNSRQQRNASISCILGQGSDSRSKQARKVSQSKFSTMKLKLSAIFLFSRVDESVSKGVELQSERHNSQIQTELNYYNSFFSIIPS